MKYGLTSIFAGIAMTLMTASSSAVAHETDDPNPHFHLPDISCKHLEETLDLLDGHLQDIFEAKTSGIPLPDPRQNTDEHKDFIMSYMQDIDNTLKEKHCYKKQIS